MGMIVNPYSFATGGSGPASDLSIPPDWNLDASQITGVSDGADLTIWQDVAGTGLDATADTSPPTWHDAVLNGKGVVRFDGTNHLDLASNPLAGAAAGTLFIVAKNLDASNQGTMLNGMGTSGSKSHFPFSNSIYDDFGSTSRRGVGSLTGPAYTDWKIWEVISAPGDWRAFTNGTLEYSTTSNTVSWGAAPKLAEAVGGGAGTAAWQGDIAQVAAYSSGLSDTDRATVRDELAIKWGI